jgi:hypothetical protein
MRQLCEGPSYSGTKDKLLLKRPEVEDIILALEWWIATTVDYRPFARGEVISGQPVYRASSDSGEFIILFVLETKGSHTQAVLFDLVVTPPP